MSDNYCIPELLLKTNKNILHFFKDQINIKNCMRTKLILFKIYTNFKHILLYFFFIDY